jgi:hypothetical protein
VDFAFWKFKKKKKIGFGRKNQSSPQFVHIAEFRRKKLILKMGKIKNVHTWPNSYTSHYEPWMMFMDFFYRMLAFEESFFF